MTAKQKLALDAEALVRRILERTFNQKVSRKLLNAAARKVVQAVPEPKEKQVSETPLRRAA